MGYRLMVDLDVVDALDRLPAKVRTRLLVHFVEEPLSPAPFPLAHLAPCGRLPA